MAERKQNRNVLFLLDHKLYASDYDSDSVASENHCENRPLQAPLSRLSPARPRFSRNFSRCAFLSCSLELAKGKLWAGETEKPPQVQTLLFTKTATDSEGLEYRPRLFNRWVATSTGLITIQRISIRETYCTIQWIMIYPMDSAIQPLNNGGQVTKWLWRHFRTLFCGQQKRETTGKFATFSCALWYCTPSEMKFLVFGSSKQGKEKSILKFFALSYHDTV